MIINVYDCVVCRFILSGAVLVCREEWYNSNKPSVGFLIRTKFPNLQLEDRVRVRECINEDRPTEDEFLSTDTYREYITYEIVHRY